MGVALGVGMGEDTLFPRKTRRGTENFNTFLIRGGRGGRGELQHLLSAEDAEGAENFNTFCPRRARRDAEKGVLSAEGGSLFASDWGAGVDLVRRQRSLDSSGRCGAGSLVDPDEGGVVFVGAEPGG